MQAVAASRLPGKDAKQGPEPHPLDHSGWGRGKRSLLLNKYRVSDLQDVKSSKDLFHNDVNILTTTKLYT